MALKTVIPISRYRQAKKIEPVWIVRVPAADNRCERFINLANVKNVYIRDNGVIAIEFLHDDMDRIYKGDQARVILRALRDAPGFKGK